MISIHLVRILPFPAMISLLVTLHSLISDTKRNLEAEQTLKNLESNLHAVLDVQQEICQELECVICLEVPLASKRVFSCSQHHLICDNCAGHVLKSCPVCQENFVKSPPTRNRLAEKILQILH